MGTAQEDQSRRRWGGVDARAPGVAGRLRSLGRRVAGGSSAQRRLAEAQAFNEAVLDGMAAGLLAVDARTGAITANQVARRMLGLADDATTDTLRQVLDAAFHDPGAGTPLAAAQQPLSRALAGDGCELDLVLPAGDARPARRVLVRARPIREPAGAVIAGAVVMHDVTEQLARERELSDHAAHIAALGSATLAVLREEDARTAVCDAARSVAAATVVALFEPDGSASLECTASSGVDLRGIRMSATGASQLALSFGQARPTYIEVDGQPTLDRQTLARVEALVGAPLRAAAYTPVVVGGRSIAVLITALGHAEPDPSRVMPMLEVLAAEAGVAIEREDLLRRLHEQAVTDPLTGLGNRRAWLEGLSRETARSRRNGEPLGVVMIDLDRFKVYNDAHGHPAGDSLLASVAGAWQGRLRGGDVICRVGGEEFGLLLPGCPATAVYDLVEDLRALVPGGQTASAGTTMWLPGEDPDATVSRADSLLYEAKDHGRDRQVYRPGPDDEALEREPRRLRIVES